MSERRARGHAAATAGGGRRRPPCFYGTPCRRPAMTMRQRARPGRGAPAAGTGGGGVDAARERSRRPADGRRVGRRRVQGGRAAGRPAGGDDIPGRGVAGPDVHRLVRRSGRVGRRRLSCRRGRRSGVRAASPATRAACGVDLPCSFPRREPPAGMSSGRQGGRPAACRGVASTARRQACTRGTGPARPALMGALSAGRACTSRTVRYTAAWTPMARRKGTRGGRRSGPAGRECGNSSTMRRTGFGWPEDGRRLAAYGDDAARSLPACEAF